MLIRSIIFRKWFTFIIKQEKSKTPNKVLHAFDGKYQISEYSELKLYEKKNIIRQNDKNSFSISIVHYINSSRKLLRKSC